jgi:DUF1680 family protein
MGSKDGGITAAIYAPCEVRTNVAGTDVHLIEETDYPFRETVRITINPAETKSFPVRLRIPSWAERATLHVNGVLQATPTPGTFALIVRKWNSGDLVELKFPMVPRSVSGYNGSVSIERGPLVFAYPIGESWVKLRDRGMTSDWQVFPKTQWNYALAVTPKSVHKLSVQESKVGAIPFGLEETPVKIEVTGRKVLEWRAVDGVIDPVPNSPVVTAEKEERLFLVPYAAAKLRVTAFPHLGDDFQT